MAKKTTMPSDDENLVEEGSGDHRTKKRSGVGTHTQEKEFQNRMKRLKKVIDADEDEDCTTAYKNCPIQNCSFTPQSDVDKYDWNQELLQHISVRHPDYCIVCKVNNSHLIFFFHRMPCQVRQW